MAAASGIAVIGGLWRRIKETALTDVGVLVRGLPADVLDEVERVLIEADFGNVAFQLVEALAGECRRGRMKGVEEVRAWLAARLLEYAGTSAPLRLADSGTSVVLLLGVNGVGKTTTVAKLGWYLMQQGRSVLFAAADTFRAGAREQLAVWAEHLGVDCVSGPPRSDPAAVAYQAIEAAEARRTDVVLVDTAGRLHTQEDLMEELRKIVRVVGRRAPGAPHESLLVLDATVGQNALAQGQTFTAAVPVTGLVLAKLDGTAKGGSVVRLRSELGVPIKFVGVGEALPDLRPFDPQTFVRDLLES